MGIERSLFGVTKLGEEVDLFTLTNGAGTQVRLINYGATLIGASVPDRNREFGDVILGFDDLASYEDHRTYMGATVGRFANRIANACFEIDGVEYRLPANDPPNALHGGLRGYDKQIWSSSSLGAESITFQLHDPAGAEGYPGAVDVSVTYTLTEDDVLRIRFIATPDQSTPINLTNHAYFNLGASPTIEDHLVRIEANAYTPFTEKSIPTGEIATVKNTPFDFRTPKPVGRDFAETPGTPKGYNANFVLQDTKDLKLAAEVIDQTSGRKLQVWTTQPGLQLYTANDFDGTMIGKGGKVYGRYAGIALEPQHFPDSPNHSDFPNSVVQKGETYRETIEFRFSTV